MNNICAICLDDDVVDMTNETFLENKTCQCKFFFHKKCIDMWIIAHNRCIICNTKFSHLNHDFKEKKMVNYDYIDSEERRRFAQVGHDYLIKNAVQNDFKNQIRLDFFHPVKEFLWDHKNDAFKSSNKSFLEYSDEKLNDPLFGTISFNATSNSATSNSATSNAKNYLKK